MNRASFYLIFAFAFLVFFNSCNIEPFEGDSSEIVEPVVTCIKAKQQTDSALLNLASATDINYTDLCDAYKEAIQEQITICGDSDGALQMIIDNLICENNPQPNNCDEINAMLASAKEAFDNAGDSDYAQMCAAYKLALQSKITICGDDGMLGLIMDNLGDCSLEEPSPAEYGFMSANIAGVEYDDLKPNLFNLTNSASIVVWFTTSGIEDAYIHLQGNSEYTSPTLLSSTKEINLFIPETNWVEGTFVLSEYITEASSISPHYTYYTFDLPDNIYNENISGSITITKVSLDERVIQGDFEFTYKLINEDDLSEEGPFEVTGTFDYPLDDEFFN